MTDPSLRRLVFYVHGFDRRGPRFFNLWQKREVRAYNARFGTDLRIGDLEDDHWRISGPGVETDFHFMDWTPVIKARFAEPFWSGMSAMISLFLVALRQGLLGQIRRSDWMMGALMIWAFLPMLLFSCCLVLALWGGGLLLMSVGCAGVLLFWLLHRYDRYFGVYYAVHVAWAARRIALRDDPALEALLRAFKAKIEGSDADEIILVGHSIGAAIALRLLEDAPGRTKLLTIGQSIPLVSDQLEAGYLRDLIAEVGRKKHVWIDISAGRDPLGFHGVAASGGQVRSFSAHFARSFGTKTLRALKWRGFDMHFLYFNAPEMSGAQFDWFAVLSGEIPLDTRFSQEKAMDGKGERRAVF